MSKGTCSVEGCERPRYARGWCTKHYNRWVNHGTTDDSAVRFRPSMKGKTCAVDGCSLPAAARDVCANHGYYLRRYGDANATFRVTKTQCALDGCDRNVAKTPAAEGLCYPHYRRRLRFGDPLHPPRPVGRTWFTKLGYRMVPHEGRSVPEHRLVMEQHLGRKLLPHENVHHLNGQRAQNNIANLELWSTSQPYGQRVPDKVVWAIELLELYAPEALSREPYQLRI